MTDIERFEHRLRKTRLESEYWTALAKLEFAEGIRRVMGGMQQSELAEKLGGKSETYVSRLLAGDYNFTLRKMNEIAHFLGAATHVYVAKRDTVLKWTALESGRQQKTEVTINDNDSDATGSGAPTALVFSARGKSFEPREALGG